MKNFLMITLLAAFLWSCDNTKKTESEEELTEMEMNETEMNETEMEARDGVNMGQDELDSQTSSSSVNFVGSYKGTTPCSDCDGIETELTLKDDNSYVLKTKHIGKDDAYLEQMGMYTLNETGNTITLGGVKNHPNMYQIGERRIIQLDAKGNRRTGDNANRYVLSK